MRALPRPTEAREVGGADLADRLSEELAAAWRDGLRTPAEEYLRRAEDADLIPDLAARIIYEEVCQRQEAGLPVDPADVIRRFPRWEAELRLLFDCHRLLDESPAPRFPEAGDQIGGFHLLSALGRGAQGRVFLACQPALADRLLVLKFIAGDRDEHRTLARLQHTHIVPLYLAQDLPDRGLVALAMPYVGGASLDRLLRALDAHAAGDRTGKHILRAIQAEAAASPLPAVPPAGPAPTGASYVEAVCRMAARLAEALQYAHDRGLLHLDLKPSNVLIAADGTPMLLDFHLARGPLAAGAPTPEWLGGTPGWMAPEQEAALAAVETREPVSADVDGRADVFALGAVTYAALGGPAPVVRGVSPRLDVCNRRVSRGLADVVHKCLAANPADRYPSAGALAADLDRHLNDLPLAGVPNRSVAERWRKWRRRRPHVLALTVMLVVAVGVVVFAAARVGANSLAERARRSREAARQAGAALAEGREQLASGHDEDAARTFRRGLAFVAAAPGREDLAADLDRHLARAERARSARALHHLADRLRFLSSADPLPRADAARLLDRADGMWADRHLLASPTGVADDSDLDERVRSDLIDLVVCRADLAVRLAGPDGARSVREGARKALADAESELGPSPVLAGERAALAAKLGRSDEARTFAARAAAMPARTAWEHGALGRAALRAGRIDEAAEQFGRALDLNPQDFWANYDLGACEYRRGRYDAAAAAFHACVALSPATAECYYSRGLARAALGHPDEALRDYDRALELAPGFSAAAVNRAVLHRRAGRLDEAVADLRRALASGADPAVVYCDLAAVYLDRHDGDAAAANLAEALRHDPSLKDARDLQERLRRRR